MSSTRARGFFDEAALRLKQQLGVNTDKEAAAALGLTPRAWAGRKAKQEVPETELLVLAAKRPELKLDVDYVLTGVDATTRQARQQMNQAQTMGRSVLRQQLTQGSATEERVDAQPLGSLRYDELAMLERWRLCSSADQALLLQLATRLAEEKNSVRR